MDPETIHLRHGSFLNNSCVWIKKYLKKDNYIIE